MEVAGGFEVGGTGFGVGSECDLPGVKGQVFMGEDGVIAVFFVADYGVARGLAVDADLVRAAGFESDLK